MFRYVIAREWTRREGRKGLQHVRRQWISGSGSVRASIDPPLEALANDLLRGQRRALAKAITLVESSRAVDRTKSEELITYLLQKRKESPPARLDEACEFEKPTPSLRLGISGPPGVGKSTFIENFGQMLTGKGLRVAVLAVDPSSVRTGGSILGDKTRMHLLSRDPRAFIRPSPSLCTLGGVTRGSSDSIMLCESAGYDVVIVETVGVGQSETDVEGLVDAFMLLALPVAGDELQGIKRGIMELADMVVVNKADGNLLKKARLACSQYRSALHLLQPKTDHWGSKVMSCSSVTGDGIEDVWESIVEFWKTMERHGHFQDRRKRQQVEWMWKIVREDVMAYTLSHPSVIAEAPELEQEIASNTISASRGAKVILSRAGLNVAQDS